MDLFANLLLGLSVAVSPVNLAWLLVGVMVGMVVGIIPGFGPSAALAILLPVTFGMDPNGAVILLAAIYYGSQYGGTITSILLNPTGESSSVASTFAIVLVRVMPTGPKMRSVTNSSQVFPVTSRTTSPATM